jgi:uncharacterized protein
MLKKFDLIFNPAENRPRAFFRLILAGMLVFILIALSQIVPLLLILVLGPDRSNPILSGLNPLLMVLVFYSWLLICGKWIDRRRFSDFGFHFNRRWWMDFAFGLSLGAFLMVFIFLTELASGWVSITATFENIHLGQPFGIGLLLAFLNFVQVGITEEIFSRGYLLRTLAEGFHFPRISARNALIGAYLLSSCIFAVLHIFNPNASLPSTISLVAAGLFLGLGFVLTGELAIPIGLHIAWNFFQGNVFGFPVSGTGHDVSIFTINQSGPSLITGGAFGPEAGLIGIAAILIGCILTFFWLRRQGHSTDLQTRLAEFTPFIQITSARGRNNDIPASLQK